MTTSTDSSHLTGFRSTLPPAITAAFGACSAMFIVAYILHLPGLSLPGALVGALMLLALGGSLFMFVKAAGKTAAIRIGTTAGVLTGLVSLIALGSALRGDEGNSGQLALMIAGWIALTTVAGALAGRYAGLRAKDQHRAPHEWTPVLGLITAISTLALITMGGIVTAAEAGLAVPDWPATFGANMFLYPLSKMTGGVYYEHAHRLMGAFVGLSTIAVMALTFMTHRSTLLRVLTVIALVLVILQGIAGGIRVTGTSIPLAIFHGILGQTFFALICVITLMSSSAWQRQSHESGALERKQFTLSLAALIVLFLQITLGALARHMPDSLHGVMTHAGFSLVAAVMIVIAGAHASKLAEAHSLIAKLGKGSVHTVGLQMVLGIAALGIVMMTRDAETPPALDLIITTAHQIVGALLFMIITLLTVSAAKARFSSVPDAN